MQWSRHELLRLQRRVHRDEKSLAAEGIQVVASGLRGDDRLSVEVATRRTDARARFRRLYGRAVRAVVVGETPTFLSCREVENYEVEPDGVTLKVHWGDSGSITPRRIEVIETPDAVYLGAVVETGFFETADLRGYTLPVTLAQPLGGRAVRNIEYEKAVRPGPWGGG